MRRGPLFVLVLCVVSFELQPVSRSYPVGQSSSNGVYAGYEGRYRISLSAPDSSHFHDAGIIVRVRGE